MDFDQGKPIYIQITGWMCEKIIKEEWLEEHRIPAVRETAMILQVNPNTAMRAYEALQNEGVIFNKRGIGFFVSSGARGKIIERERQEFMSDALPVVFGRMDLLGITGEDLIKQYEKYKTSK